ncbi:MAG: transglycosylase, partial [Clostridia bacterium]|nr:transglycosylase [Clostridia bacterium]
KTKLNNTVTSYFTDAVIDDVITDLQEKLGYTEEQASNLLYRGGLKIYTTQDQKLQKICDSVLSDSSLYPANTQYELTFRLTTRDKNGKLHNYDELMLQKYFRKKDASFDLLFSDKKTAQNYVKKYKKHIIKKSDTIEGENVTLTLQPQISFVLMDQSTGKVKALVGGRGEKIANRTLNRATSTVRQPGSTFKVLSTYLPALDATNMTLASVQDDAEYYYPGTGKRVKNWYSSGYRGLCTLREGIKDSLNVVTVKTLADVTPKTGFSYLKKLGFSTLVGDTSLPAHDVTLATSLGGLTYGVTNLETTAAYASIANQGIYREPVLYTKILDHDGNILIDNTAKKKRVMKEGTAYLLTSAMKDVVNCGTGTLTRFTTSSMPVAGKTGTTTDNVDAWFVGYTPYYTAGIWMGYDNNQSLMGTTYHKTIWRKIMEQVHKDCSVKNFEKPSSVVTATICTKSGKLALNGVCNCAAGGSTIRTEYFTAGTAPTKYCDAHVKVKVCKSSGKIPGSYCPKKNITYKIFLKKNETSATKDTPYVISSTKCTVHTKESKTKKNSKKNTSTKKISTKKKSTITNK